MASLDNSRLPINQDWSSQIPNEILASFQSSDPPIIFIGSGFGKEAIPPLKTGGELAALLRTELGLDDSGESLAELLQYLQNHLAGSKKRVIDWLKEKLLYGKSEPGGAYRLLLELPTNVFLTTNYDLLMMDASRQINYRLIQVDDPLSFVSTSNDIKTMPRTGLIGRLHGGFEAQEKIVATTDDYIKWYTSTGKRWRDLLEGMLRDKRIVFIGYSLRDFTTWTSFISVFAEWSNNMNPHALVSPTSSKHFGPFWDHYNMKYIPLKAYQFLIAVHDSLGNLEKNKELALAAVAACYKKSYEETLKFVEKTVEDNHYVSAHVALIRMIMDGSYEN
jgi:hypothetical protein